MATRITNFPGWDADGRVATSESRHFMTEYTGVPPSEIEHHVRTIAKKGWDKLQYPCFGMLWFLHFDLSQSPAYPEILTRVKNGSLLLDLGCGLGQDIRRLVHDGAPQRNIVGLDLHAEFIDLGFELFNDRASMDSTFIVQDFFDRSQRLEEWKGCFGVINSGYFMHLWDWDGQVEVARRMVGFLALDNHKREFEGEGENKGEGEGKGKGESASCIVTGVHFGSKQTGRWEKVPADNDPIFLHDSASLAEFWRIVGDQTGCRVEVWSAMEQDDDHARLDPKGHRLRWFVKLSSK